MAKTEKPISEVEETVLLAILSLDGESYGVPILKRIAERTGQEMSIGTIYVALERLEEQGYVSTRIGEATKERGGRAKKYFKVNGSGMRALEDKEQMRNALRAGGRSLQPGLS